MIIDFHTHSHASDGALSPQVLLQRALEAGVQQFALTDHDTVAGYLELLNTAVALPEGFELLSGVELSCCWGNITIHVVGLGMDLEHAAMKEALELLGEARQLRARTIAERLARAGFEGALDGALLEAGNSQIGRPHFAAWMVAQGHVADANAAFDKYLGAGRPGDVKAFWPALSQAVDWLVRGGGVAVLAHPLKYKMTRMKLRRLLTDFQAAGGLGLEVLSGRQTEEQTTQLCKLAREFGLQLSAGSDFHRDWKYGPDVGVDVSGFPDLPALWRKQATL
jgi:predicted metal-dependent phosphoesterase TrpH